MKMSQEREVKELQDLLPQDEVLKIGKYEVLAKPYNLNDWVIIFSRFSDLEALNLNDVSVFRLLLWLQVRKDERFKTVTEEEVGEEITLKDLPRLIPVIERMIAQSLPEEEVKKGEKLVEGSFRFPRHKVWLDSSPNRSDDSQTTAKDNGRTARVRKKAREGSWF
ncbi:MAG: hypothetical protein RMK94_14570 [Armatimonadota bacterium]|nr:hypothetical protein [Armatimonadota bacterium]